MSKAQAKWELELSRTILARRKKVLVALVLPILIGLVWSSAGADPQSAPASAPTESTSITPATSSSPATSSAPATAPASGDNLPSKVPVLGGSKAFMPSQVNMKMFLGSILVGLIAGLITGVIGAGGGYILTPALMSFGVRGIMSVGTDQFHLFAKAIMGTSIHRKLGNVNLGLAVWFVVGSAGGVTLGGWLSRWIFNFSPALSDAVISLVYVVVLGILGIYAIFDWIRLRKSGGASSTEATTGFARWLQRNPAWPRVRFDEQMVPGGRRISVYPLIISGFTVGFVASIMGVGGGFLTFPIFVYGLGVSTFTTVGTDILQIIFTAGYSSIFQYALYGFVFYTIAIGMLVGSLFGVQLGAMVTNIAKGAQIRMFFALTILAGFINRLFALPRKMREFGYLNLTRDTCVAIEDAGVWIFFGIVGIFALWILWTFFRHVRLMRRDRLGEPMAPGGPLIVNGRKLALGLAGLAVFTVLLVIGLKPSDKGETALTSADNFFNELSKQSAYYIPDARKELTKKRGGAGFDWFGLWKSEPKPEWILADEPVDIGISPQDATNVQALMCVVGDSGCVLKYTDDKRIRISGGTLGQLSKTALEDAEAAFRNDSNKLHQEHGLRCHEVAYCWWVVFDGLSKRYNQENKAEHVEFTKFMSAKVFEPAYNFRGIEAKKPGENILPMTGLLGFYILYTLWYGFSILLVMEGLGVTMHVAKGRKET